MTGYWLAGEVAAVFVEVVWAACLAVAGHAGWELVWLGKGGEVGGLCYHRVERV